MCVCVCVIQLKKQFKKKEEEKEERTIFQLFSVNVTCVLTGILFFFQNFI